MFRLFECCALSFFERFVLSFSLKIERFVSDSAEIWICGLYIIPVKYFFQREFPKPNTYQYQQEWKCSKISRRSGIKTGAMNHYLHIIGKPESFFNGTIIEHE